MLLYDLTILGLMERIEYRSSDAKFYGPVELKPRHFDPDHNLC